jgi:hypothetical protein
MGWQDLNLFAYYLLGVLEGLAFILGVVVIQ